MPFDPQPHLLRTLVNNAVEGGANYLPESEVSVNVIDRAPDIRVCVDPERLHQVLANLLSNAVKFSPPGESITAEISRFGSHARISIADRGPGIPPDFKHRIFGKFEQADTSDSRAKGGTGLGLSIAKSIVEQSGGRISFETGPVRGTTFHVDLPELVDDGSMETDSRFGEPATGSAALSGHRGLSEGDRLNPQVQKAARQV